MPVARRIRTSYILAVIALAAASALEGAVRPADDVPPAPASEVHCAAAFGDPLAELSADQRRAFDAGFQLFIKRWTPSEGLGPNVNAENCIGCHAEPMPGGSGTEARTLVRHLDVPASSPSPTAIFQRFVVTPEGKLVPRPFPAATTARRTPPLFGLGLLEAVPDADRLRLVERNRERDDGVRGRLLRIDGAFGRFGWNGNFRTIDDIVRFAFVAEMGLESDAHPDADRHAHVEVPAEQVRAVAEYIRFLAPPPRHPARAGVEEGETLFARAACTACHQPSLRTDPAVVLPLANRVIHPYTDLLIHDMGELGEGLRTPPLWGLSSTGPPFLHDGRASTAEEAILLHGGESRASVEAFKALSAAERRLLLEFLDSL